MCFVFVLQHAKCIADEAPRAVSSTSTVRVLAMVLAVSQVVLVVGHGDQFTGAKEGRGGRRRMKMTDEDWGPLKDDDRIKGRRDGSEMRGTWKEMRVSSARGVDLIRRPLPRHSSSTAQLLRPDVHGMVPDPLMHTEWAVTGALWHTIILLAGLVHFAGISLRLWHCTWQPGTEPSHTASRTRRPS